MKINDILAGIEILRRYTKSEYAIEAGHDEIWFTIQQPVSEDDNAALRALGWASLEDELDDDGEVATQDRGGPWRAFV